MSDFPAHEDPNVAYTADEFLVVCRAIKLRLIHNGNVNVTISFLGPTGERTCKAVIEDCFKDKFTFKDKRGDEFLIEVCDHLFFIDWVPGTPDRKGAFAESVRLSLDMQNESNERLTRQTEIANKLREEQLAEQRNSVAAQEATTKANVALLEYQKQQQKERDAKRAPVNTHVSMVEQFVANWHIADDVVKKFPRFIFPPRLTPNQHGADSANKSAGFNTDEILMILQDIINEALTLLRWGPDKTRERETLCERLKDNALVTFLISAWQGDLEGLSYRDAFWIAEEDYISKNPDKFQVRFKLIQAHAVGPNASSLTDEDAVKRGVVPGILGAHDGLPADTKTSRAGLRLVLSKDKKIVSPSNVSNYSVTVTASPPAAIVHPRPSKNKWLSGGAPATLSSTSKPLISTHAPNPAQDPPKDVPSGGGPPADGASDNQGNGRENAMKYRYPDMKPKARLRDWVLHLILRGVVAAYGNQATVLFPDRVRLLTKKSECLLLKTEGIALGERPCLAPLLVRESHWVLLYITEKEICIRDSDRNFTKDEATSIANGVKHQAPELRGAKVVCDLHWPQQDYNSADCGLFVARAALQFLSDKSTEAASKLLTRKDLDAILPEQTKNRSKELSPDALHQFFVRMAKHLGRPPPPPPMPPPPPVMVSSGSSALPTVSSKTTCHTCKFNEHMGADAICGKELQPKKSIACCKCNQLFCSTHAATWHDKSSWQCQRCRPSWRTKGRTHDPTDFTMPPPTVAEVAKAEEDFQSGQGSPLLAHHAGSIIGELKSSLKNLQIHPHAYKGVAKDTRADHQRMLTLLAEAPAYQRTWPIARAALDALERGRLKYKWGWQTMSTKMGRMEGALSRLALYTQDRLQPVRIRYYPEWKDAVTHISRLTAQYKATGLPSITEEEIEKAIASSPTDDIKALIILSWAFVARCGDMSQVKTDCLHLGTPKADGSMEVTAHFERGKVIGKIDPYSVTTTIPSRWVPFLLKWAAEKKTDFLFQMSSLVQRKKFLGSVRQHLRTIREDLDIRSIRRGAAQAMARNKVPLDQIRYFTRHADVSMLRRYLQFGRAESEETRKGAAAGLAVWSKDC